MSKSIYYQHAEFEQRGLWSRFGYFNLFVLGMLPFWLPFHGMPSCSDRTLGIWLNVLFILLFALIVIGLESMDRVRLLKLPVRDWMSSLAISFIRNLAGFPLYLLWVTLPHARLFYFGLLVAFLPWIWLSRLLIYPEKPVSSQKKYRVADYLAGAGVYLACLLVLTISTLPNFIGSIECMGTRMVKGNMHTIQTLVETYALENGGKFPQHFAELKANGKQKGYWKDFTNVWGRVSERCHDQFEGKCAYLLMSDYPKDMPKILPDPHRFDYLIGLPMALSTGPINPYDWAGLVLYEPVSPMRYFIYGTNKIGLIIRDKGQAFVLTNS